MHPTMPLFHHLGGTHLARFSSAPSVHAPTRLQMPTLAELVFVLHQWCLGDPPCRRSPAWSLGTSGHVHMADRSSAGTNRPSEVPVPSRSFLPETRAALLASLTVACWAMPRFDDHGFVLTLPSQQMYSERRLHVSCGSKGNHGLRCADASGVSGGSGGHLSERRGALWRLRRQRSARPRPGCSVTST